MTGWDLPQMHQDSFQLFASHTKVLEIDDHLGDLRQIAYRLELVGDLLADVVGQQVIERLHNQPHTF